MKWESVFMKILLVGVGGVGESFATIAKRRDPSGKRFQLIVLADYNLTRAVEVQTKLVDQERFPTEQVNARNGEEIIALAKKYDVDLIMNTCDPSFNEVIFDSAYEAGCNYMDCAMTVSTAHKTDPFHQCGTQLGDYQFAKDELWKEKGLLALCGSGVEPGMSDVFSRFAEKHLFDEIEEIGIRDGNNFYLEGVDVAFGFSIWTTIEECLNPPIIWEKDKGWFTTEPFSEPEIFILPEGIGPVEMVNVEHEEVMFIPKHINKGLKRVTFKMGLGDAFIGCLKYLKALNLDRIDMHVKIGDSEITPREFITRCAPNPVEVGKKMKGKTCAGTWIKGKKDGMERQIYLYQVADNEECVEKLDCQAVVAQTAFVPVLMCELISKGVWKGVGVKVPEQFDPDPFVESMDAYEFPGRLMEMDSQYKQASDFQKIIKML